MNTLAKELEDLETRRAAGTISDDDAALAKQALLSRASATSEAGPRAGNPNRGLFGWIIAGVFANLMLSLIGLAGLAAIAYLLLPLALAVPILICAVFILPVLWLLDWIGDLL